MKEFKENYKNIKPDQKLKDEIFQRVTQGQNKKLKTRVGRPLLLTAFSLVIIFLVVQVLDINPLKQHDPGSETVVKPDQEDHPVDPKESETTQLTPKEVIYNHASIISASETEIIEDTSIKYEISGLGINAIFTKDIEKSLDLYVLPDGIEELHIFRNPNYKENVHLEPDYEISAQDILELAAPFIERFSLDVENIEITEYGYEASIKFLSDDVLISKSDYINSYFVTINNLVEFAQKYGFDSDPVMANIKSYLGTDSKTRQKQEDKLNLGLKILGLSDERQFHHQCTFDFEGNDSCNSYAYVKKDSPEDQIFSELTDKIRAHNLYLDKDGNVALQIVLGSQYQFESLGQFPIISKEEALDKLKNHEAATTTPLESITDDLVFYQGLKYLDIPNNQVIVPVHVFMVDLEEYKLQDMFDSKHYGYFYVPAMDWITVKTSFN